MNETTGTADHTHTKETTGTPDPTADPRHMTEALAQPIRALSAALDEMIYKPILQATLRCQASLEAARLREKLITLRHKRKISQTELAKLTGMSRQRISRIENGHENIIAPLQAYALAVGARITIEIEPAERKGQTNDR